MSHKWPFLSYSSKGEEEPFLITSPYNCNEVNFTTIGWPDLYLIWRYSRKLLINDLPYPLVQFNEKIELDLFSSTLLLPLISNIKTKNSSSVILVLPAQWQWMESQVHDREMQKTHCVSQTTETTNISFYPNFSMTSLCGSSHAIPLIFVWSLHLVCWRG